MDDDDRIERGIFKGWRQEHAWLFLLAVVIAVLVAAVRICS